MTTYSHNIILNDSKAMLLKKILLRSHEEYRVSYNETKLLRQAMDMEQIEEMLLDLLASRQLKSFSSVTMSDSDLKNYLALKKSNTPENFDNFKPDLALENLWFSNYLGRDIWCSIQETSENAVCLYFINTRSEIFDKRTIHSINEAEKELKMNEFYVFNSEINPNPPKAPYKERRKPIFSSYLFWKNGIFEHLR